MRSSAVELVEGHELWSDTFWSDGDTVDGLQCALCYRVFRDLEEVRDHGPCDVYRCEPDQGQKSDGA